MSENILKTWIIVQMTGEGSFLWMKINFKYS